MAGRSKKPRIDKSLMANNPFVVGLKIPITKKDDVRKFELDEDGDLLNLGVKLEVEKSIKVYKCPHRRLIISSLGPSTSKLLTWIQQELESNIDWFWLNKERYLRETGMAYNTYKRALFELISNGFIVESMHNDVFWINPYFFFPGNRVNKYKKNVVVKRVID